jgi:hypothetical protein
MMSEKRVVVLKNYNRLPQSGKELILKYCKNPAPHTILVLVTGEVDLRKKGYAELKKLVELVECKSPYEKKIPMHISQFVENRGKKISFRAINLLQAKLGNSLSGIIGQVEKLISFKHDQSGDPPTNGRNRGAARIYRFVFNQLFHPATSCQGIETTPRLAQRDVRAAGRTSIFS